MNVSVKEYWNRVEFSVDVDLGWLSLDDVQKVLSEAKAALLDAGAVANTLELRIETDYDYGSIRTYTTVTGHRPLTRAEEAAVKRREDEQKAARAAQLREELARLEA